MSERTEAAARWIVLARLLRPQGRKGEVLAELLTDFPERFERGSRVFLAEAGFAGEASQAGEMTVSSFWLPVGRNAGRVVLGFEGITSISEAEVLGGLEVIVPEEERVSLPEDSEYVDDLVGCSVWDAERLVGVVDGVDFPTTPDGVRRLEHAAPLLTVRTAEGQEVLIPYVQDFLVSLNVAAKQIRMRLPDGLIELNG